MKKKQPSSSKINCRTCINWIDESLDQIEEKGNPIFMGCRVFGYVENSTALDECSHFTQSENLFAICAKCKTTVPKVCLSLGECVNCTDTDLYCVDHCHGGVERKYCTHFVRLHTEGAHLIQDDRVFDLFPAVGMPASENKDGNDEGSTS